MDAYAALPETCQRGATRCSSGAGQRLTIEVGGTRRVWVAEKMTTPIGRRSGSGDPHPRRSPSSCTSSRTCMPGIARSPQLGLTRASTRSSAAASASWASRPRAPQIRPKCGSRLLEIEAVHSAIGCAARFVPGADGPFRRSASAVRLRNFRHDRCGGLFGRESVRVEDACRDGAVERIGDPLVKEVVAVAYLVGVLGRNRTFAQDRERSPRVWARQEEHDVGRLGQRGLHALCAPEQELRTQFERSPMVPGSDASEYGKAASSKTTGAESSAGRHEPRPPDAGSGTRQQDGATGRRWLRRTP